MPVSRHIVEDMQADTATKRYVRRPSRERRFVRYANVYQFSDGRQIIGMWLLSRSSAHAFASECVGTRVCLLKIKLKSAA